LVDEWSALIGGAAGEDKELIFISTVFCFACRINQSACSTHQPISDRHISTNQRRLV